MKAAAHENIHTLLLVTVLTLNLAFDAHAADPQKGKPGRIYERIGGQAAIDLFYTKVLKDKRVNEHFDNVNMKRLHKRQKAFFAAALGGPVPYQGKDMRKAHAHMDITEKDFYIIAEHLQNTLAELKVDPKLIKEVIAVVATTKDAALNRTKK